MGQKRIVKNRPNRNSIKKERVHFWAHIVGMDIVFLLKLIERLRLQIRALITADFLDFD